MNIKRNVAIRAAMLEHSVTGHWSDEEVMRRTGWAKHTWRRYRNGEFSGIDILASVAWVLACDPEHLVSDDVGAVTSRPIPAWSYLEDFSRLGSIPFSKYIERVIEEGNEKWI